MAGRIAEEMFMHHMTTGAGNDIERATDLARKMVCEWGMSELGPMSFGKKEEQIFLGREIAQHRDYSEDTAIRIDEQVKKLVEGGYDTAEAVIDQHSEALVTIAEMLLEREMLDGSEVTQLIKGQTLAPQAPRETPGGDASRCIRPEAGRRVPGAQGEASAAGVIPAFPVYLFDLDGTLLDSAQDICGAIQQVLAVQSLARRHLRVPQGLHRPTSVRSVRRVVPALLSERMDALLAQYRSVYLARGHTQTSVYPGVAEALATLGGRKATATTKGSPTTRAVLEQFGLIQHFDHVQGTDGFPCKPAPDVLLTALAAMGARPEECLFVGDSAADMEAGRRAGVKTCAVSYGYGKREDLAQFTPNYWIDDLRELTPQSVKA